MAVMLIHPATSSPKSQVTFTSPDVTIAVPLVTVTLVGSAASTVTGTSLLVLLPLLAVMWVIPTCSAVKFVAVSFISVSDPMYASLIAHSNTKYSDISAPS